MMMQLKFTVEIETGLTKRQKGWNAQLKPLLLRVIGTPQQHRAHHSGVEIHSKISFPVDQAFASSLDHTLSQVVALC